MTIIKSIELDTKEMNSYVVNDGENKSKIIQNLSKINILIGSNNSGKSKFLRNIFSDEKLRINVNTTELNSYNEMVIDINNEIEEYFKEFNITSIGGFNLDSKLGELKYLEIGKNYLEGITTFVLNLKSIRDDDAIFYKGTTSIPLKKITHDVASKLRDVGLKYQNELDKLDIEEFLVNKSFKKIYIPVLRGLRPLAEGKDLFYERTKKDYFEGEDLPIFTGQNLYNDVLKLLCGDLKDRKHLKEFEEFIGDNFFNTTELSLIPKIGEDVLYVKIGCEREQPIYNLGDGIQSIIILTFQLFANKGEQMIFFIEEPELYLHPGLQRKLIEVLLMDEFKTYQYFITTHSNNLLDLTLDMNCMSVYKFNKEIDDNTGGLEKDSQFIIENVNDGDNSVLKLLGVNNSSIFISNCTIWVEGITDRFYLRKYFEIYQTEKFKNKEIDRIFNEDIHYSFIEYSGGNITHWDFLDDKYEEIDGTFRSIKHNRICNKIFLIADNDGYTFEDEGSKKGLRLKKLEEFFKDKFYCLNAKEIENILSPSVIKATVSMFKDKRVKDSDKDRDGILFNNTVFDIEDYRNINLGKFINDKINEQIEESNENYTRRRNYQKGNTIASKVKFCEYAVENIKSLEDMSEDAIELCEKIYNFINQNN